MPVTPPSGRGAAVFAGGGAWLPRRPREATPPGAALLLSQPCRILVAEKPAELPGLLAEVEAEQQQGRYVAGYVAYEAGAAFGLTVREPAPDALPLAWMAVYPAESATAVPEAEWREYLDQADVTRVAEALARIKPELSVSRDEYVDAITRVREYIAAGDTYQVNYTVRARFPLYGAGAAGAAASGGAASGGGVRSGTARSGAASDGAIDPLDYFLALVMRQQVPYAAYFDLGDSQVISLSPEMFLRRDGLRLESRPMKGTRPRGATHAHDVALAYELAETEKERAENLMIVDMVRNDLGRVCRAGSVRVPALYAVEPYRTVWQMVSTVVGDVNPRASLADIMRAMFPGASITGAPKHHTMEIIAQLETEPRGVYTGAVCLFCPGGDFTCNIAIRTIIHRDGQCMLGTGSGIVWDAEPTSEYEETLVKASFATAPVSRPGPGGPGSDGWRPDPRARMRAAFTPGRPVALPPGVSAIGAAPAEGPYLFETILLEAREGDETMEYPSGLGGLSPSLTLSDAAILARYRFVDEHLARMEASAATLGLPFDADAAKQVLIGLARITPDLVVVRIELDAAADFSLSCRSLPGQVSGPDGGLTCGGAGNPERDPGGDAPARGPEGNTLARGSGGGSASPVTLLVSPFRTDPDDPFLRHKTSVRGFYNREHRRALHEGHFDALFANRLDHVTEGAITNVFARFGRRWITPPVTDGLLPGIWRAWFLAQKSAEEASLTLEELQQADEIVVGNSVRGAVTVSGLAADPLEF